MLIKMIEFNSQFYAVIKELQQKELTKNIHNDFVELQQMDQKTQVLHLYETK